MTPSPIQTSQSVAQQGISGIAAVEQAARRRLVAKAAEQKAARPTERADAVKPVAAVEESPDVALDLRKDSPDDPRLGQRLDTRA